MGWVANKMKENSAMKEEWVDHLLGKDVEITTRGDNVFYGVLTRLESPISQSIGPTAILKKDQGTIVVFDIESIETGFNEDDYDEDSDDDEEDDVVHF